MVRAAKFGHDGGFAALAAHRTDRSVMPQPTLPPLLRGPLIASLLLAWGALCASGIAHAQSDPGEVGPQPLWEVGAVGVGVSQQAYPGSDFQVRRGLVLPYFFYRGKVLRADRDTTGLRAIKTDTFELDLGVAGAFGSSSDKIEARRGMPDLGTLIEFGPRLRWVLGAGPGGGTWRAVLPLRGVFDLSDRGAHRGMSLEPELQFRRRADAGWNYTASVGAIFADQRLAHTFYEVAPAYVRADRPAYEASAGLVAWRLGAFATHKLDRDWRVFGFARMDTVAGAANRDSPLVRRQTGFTAGMGVSWTWLRSDALAQD